MFKASERESEKRKMKASAQTTTASWNPDTVVGGGGAVMHNSFWKEAPGREPDPAFVFLRSVVFNLAA